MSRSKEAPDNRRDSHNEALNRWDVAETIVHLVENDNIKNEDGTTKVFEEDLRLFPPPLECKPSKRAFLFPKFSNRISKLYGCKRTNPPISQGEEKEEKTIQELVKTVKNFPTCKVLELVNAIGN